MIAKIAVQGAAYHFDKLYDYAIPQRLAETLAPGCRVTVPFGRSRSPRLGLVVQMAEGEPEGSLKEILTAVDATPVLNQQLLGLLCYLKETTFCTWFEALGALLPPGIGVKTNPAYTLCRDWEQRGELTPTQRQILDFLAPRRTPCPEDTICEAWGLESDHPELAQLVELGAVQKTQQVTRRVQDERQMMVRFAAEPPVRGKITPKQQAVLELLEQVGTGSLKEICYFAGVTRAVVDKLVAAGQLELYEVESYRNPYEGRMPPREREEIVLSPGQQAAFDTLQGLCDNGKAGQTALLYGVTGSGKTQVFLRLIQHVVSTGRSALVLVPEIALTPQTIELFHRRFGRRVAVLHSGLSMSQRLDEWKRAKQGLADIVVGTRSAVFAPLNNLGLIVIDEEQEHTYRSESAPRFDAREVARYRSRTESPLVLLASATPSVESFYQAKQGAYTLVTLPQRYGTARLPDITVVDLRDASAEEGFSQPLLDEIYHNLQVGEQTILLLNRRGHSTQVKCMSCGAAAECPNCAVSMTYHTANGRLLCHYCGYSTERLGECPHCGSSFMRYSGLGTQRAQERLQELFPEARILRMDTDTTMSRYAYERGLADFRQGCYDIMIGTQMVAKGLDFPNVTLVGVLLADQSLYSGDFRSFERTFSLLTQVAGRCGRAQLPGRAFIQTYTPENPIIELAATQRYEDFYKDEIVSRKLHLYPPFCRIFCVGFTGEAEQAVHRASVEFSALLAKVAKEEFPQLPARVLGPLPATVPKVAGRYRYRLLVKCRGDAETRRFFDRLLTQFGKAPAARGVAVFVDPHYDSGF